MPYFRYLAKNKHQETVKGKVEAKSPHQAAMLLQDRQLVVISIRQINTGGLQLVESKPGFKDIVNLTQQLSTMINAGLSLAEALNILQQQLAKPTMFKLVSDLIKEIEGGNSFADALAKHPDVFSPTYIQLVKAGEIGGVLDEVMLRLADTLERNKKLRAKIKGAMIYPMFIIIAIVVAMGAMMIFVVPQMEGLYADLGVELPGPTQVVVAISRFLIGFWWLVGGVVAGLYFAFRSWTKTPAGRKAFDGFLNELPVFGDLREKMILTEFARTMSLLLGAGVHLVQSLMIVGTALPSVNYQAVIHYIADQVEKGAGLSQSIEVSGKFPTILPQMISVGEETGRIDEVLGKLAKYFDAETQEAVKSLTSLMEPLIMIVLGVGVGFMIVAIILPIYSLTSAF